MMLNKAADPIDTKFLFCKGFCKLMDMTGGEEGAAAGIERDLIDQNVFLLNRQSLRGVDALSPMDPHEVVI